MPKFVIIGIVILAVIGGGILLLTQKGTLGGEQEVTAPKEAGRQLKNITLIDYKGNSVELTDFLGKPMVVNSWAAWCPFCVKELPDFASLQKAFPEEVVVIAIDRSESLNTAKSYTDDLGITEDLVFLLDRSDSFYRSIDGFSMPETIFVDKDGIIQYQKRGPMDLDEMKQRVKNIL